MKILLCFDVLISSAGKADPWGWGICQNTGNAGWGASTKKGDSKSPRNTTVAVSGCKTSLLHQARKGSEEITAASPKLSCSDSAVEKRSSPSKKGQRSGATQNVSGPSPTKSPAPVKTSSKLAMMKKKDEEKSKMTISPVKMKISPKKEPITSSNLDKKVTHKTEATPTSVKISPKKPEVKTWLLI